MSHSVRRVLSLLLVAAVAHAQDAAAPALLPLDDGTRWTYRVSERQGNVHCGPRDRVPFATRTVVVRVDGDRLVVEDGGEEHAATLSRASAPPEAHHDARGHVPSLQGFFLRAEVGPPRIPDEHRSTGAVEVPAGRFETVVYRRGAPLGLGSFTLERHFAPGVGLINERLFSEVEGGYREFVWELVSADR